MKSSMDQKGLKTASVKTIFELYHNIIILPFVSQGPIGTKGTAI